MVHVRHVLFKIKDQRMPPTTTFIQHCTGDPRLHSNTNIRKRNTRKETRKKKMIRPDNKIYIPTAKYKK